MEFFEINIKASADSDGDRKPDVAVKVEAFGLVVIDQTINLDPADAFALLGGVVGSVRKLIGR